MHSDGCFYSKSLYLQVIVQNIVILIGPIIIFLSAAEVNSNNCHPAWTGVLWLNTSEVVAYGEKFS